MCDPAPDVDQIMTQTGETLGMLQRAVQPGPLLILLDRKNLFAETCGLIRLNSTMWSSPSPGPECGTFGLGLPVFHSCINHSCSPNTLLTQDPESPIPRYILKAAREMAIGEELTISYLEPDDRISVNERRKQLKDQYLFDCMCQLCVRQLREQNMLEIFDELLEATDLADSGSDNHGQINPRESEFL
eukprot:TRINITY_DN15597_c0_g1_i4.p1 TRINITY_DN15597_c0_g1~~TRINITY_DN15597_c0_g1_i4.p1  ORF type:complete len:188 (-),score=23.34 TRINITY_DN15597_c0_g1_i4:173-736(-)